MARLERTDLTPVSPFDGVDESRLIDTLRIQHENEQTGNPSFSWEQLTRVSSSALYSLGAKGKFYHPEFGLIHAVYVQFADAIDAETLGGSPVGIVANQPGFSYRVTHQIAQSAEFLTLGFAGAYDDISANEYGWVITDGINLQTVKVLAPLKPGKLKKLAWQATGALGEPNSTSCGYIFNASGVTNGEVGEFLIQPGALRIEITSFSTAEATDALDARLAAIEAVLPGLVSRNDVISIRNETGQSLAALERTATVLTQQIASISDNEILAEINTKVAVTANYANVSAVNAQNTDLNNQLTWLNLQASVQSRDTARIYRDETGAIAEATQVSYLNAQAASNLASANASIIESKVAIAEAAAASAASSLALISQYSVQALNPNPDFLDYSDPVYPDSWSLITGTPPVNLQGLVEVTKESGFYGNFVPRLRAVTSDSQGGLKQVRQGGLDSIGRGVYVFEVDVEQITTQGLRGLFARVDFYTGPLTTIGETLLLNCWTEIPPNGTAASAAPGSGIGLYQRFRILYQTTLLSPEITGAGLYFFYDDTPFFSVPTNAQAKLHRMALRPAGVSEADSAAAVDIALDVAADLLVEQTTRANADTAISSTVTGLSAQVISVSDDLTALNTSLSTIESSLTVQSGINSTQATAITTLQSNYTSLDTRVDTVEPTVAGLVTSVTNLTTTSATHTSQITTLANENSAQATSLTSLNSQYSNLNTRVTAAEGQLTTVTALTTTSATHTTQINTLATENAAQATSLTNLSATYTTLNTTVVELDGRVDAAEISLTTVNTTLVSHSTAIGTLATENVGQATSITNLSARMTSAENGLAAVTLTSASHTTSINTLVTNTTATATQVTTLTSQVGALTTTVTENTSSIDGIEGKRTLEINVNGAITGTELIGGGGRSDFIIRADNFKMFTSTGNRQIFSVSVDKIQLGTDLYLGGFKIIMDNGTAMFVLGTGFGAANNFILWYGPSGNPATVTTAGALFYLTTTQTGYFGGNLNPGVLYTSRQTSDLAANASVQIGPFGTNGNDRVYNIGATYTMRYFCNSGTGALTGATNIQVTIQRLDGASWTTLGVLNLNDIERTVTVDGEPGIPDRVDYVAGGAIQITDNTHSTGTVTLRAVMTTRVTANFIGTGFGSEVHTQTITISSSEEPF